MPYSSLIASNVNKNKRPAYARKRVEDRYYTDHANSEIRLPLPRISLARLRHAINAARQAFATFTPAPRN